MKLTAQLAFNGNCREAFELYETVLNGKIKVMNSLGDTKDVPLPPGSNPSAPEHIRFAERPARRSLRHSLADSGTGELTVR